MQVVEKMIQKGLSISTMESCTSGALASAITNTEGASAIFPGAFIAYSNDAKIQNGVSQECIETYGVYSKETAIEMALACKNFYHTDFGIGVTGTFQNKDTSNMNGIPNIIYFAIASKVGNQGMFRTCAFELRLPFTFSRVESKNYVVKQILKELEKLLEKE